MRTTCIIIAWLGWLSAAHADHVVLVAGGGTEDDGSLATRAKVVQPFAIDFAIINKTEQLYFVEMVGGERLRTITEAGKLVTIAGSGAKGDSTEDRDRAPLKAEFNGLHHLAISKNGLVYLADTFNNRVRTYDLNQQKLLPFAGTGKKGFSGDGDSATQALFSQTICIALTPDEKRLYVADIGNKRVRAIDLETGHVSTFAGTGKAGIPKDGELANDQPLVDPRAIAVDSKGNVYILERSGHALRVVSTDGKIRTVVGTGQAGPGANSQPARQATLNGPKHVSIDKDDSVFIADTENHQIRKYKPEQETVELVAGTGKKGGHFDNDPKKLELARPHGVSIHPKTGDLFIADSDNGRIIKIVRD
jgi:DNA-binding beta-propeller fold protein YncE